MNVLQVGAFPFPNPNGSQVYTAGMCRGLARIGHSVALVCYAHGRGPAPREVDILRTPRVPGGAFDHSGWHWSKPLQDAALLRVMVRALRRRPVDVVHAHNVEATLIARRALDHVGHPAPLVYGMHALLAEEFPRYFGAGWGLAGRGLDRAATRAADAAVAISERGATWLSKRVNGPVAYLPPGVDLDSLEGGDAARARQRWDLGDRPWVAYCGNADAYQDLPDLFAAMGSISAGLLLVTSSPTGDLHALADDTGLSPAKLRLVHSKNFADTRDALSAAELAVIPRAECAGFPIKLLNQLGMGVVSVCARGSARDLPGVVPVPNHAPASLAEAVNDLLANPKRRTALSTAARKGIREGWTWRHQAGRLADFYAGVA